MIDIEDIARRLRDSAERIRLVASNPHATLNPDGSYLSELDAIAFEIEWTTTEQFRLAQQKVFNRHLSELTNPVPERKDMTTVTKSRKRAGGSRTKAATAERIAAGRKPSSNGKPRTAGSKDAPGQKFIAGTEPEKIPELDAMVSKYTNFKKASENARDSANDELGKIKSKMEEVNIEFYKTPFGDVSLQHGVTIIKVKLPKSQ